jgi:hypothetical protein
MKRFKKIIILLTALWAIILLGVACSSEWNNHYNLAETTSAFDLLKGQSEFSEFVQLIEQNHLEDLLKGSAVTVFAPANGSIRTSGFTEPELNNLLRQHIVSGRLTADLASGKNYFASNGAVLSFDATFTKVNGIIISQHGTQKNGSIIHKVASLMNSTSKGTLYGFLRKNKSIYSYILSLYDNVTFDEKASAKYVDANGKMAYDSVFLAKSSYLDPYLSNSDYSTVILFTDQQFDNGLTTFSSAVNAAISASPAIKKGLIAQTYVQNVFKGSKILPSGTENWQAVNGLSQAVNSVKLNAKIEVLQNVSVMKYSDLSSNLATNYFSLLIQADNYTLAGVEGASGGTNAHEVISVPQFAKGNGLARRIYPNSTAGNSHAFFTIGGVQKGSFVPVLNGVNYKINMCISLTRSIKCILWVYDQGTADKKLYLDADANFDSSKNFICNTLNGEMRVIEFPVQLLYTRVANNAPTFKFHVDYRPLALTAFPQINGVAPTVAQTGIVIDYLEFIPVLN